MTAVNAADPLDVAAFKLQCWAGETDPFASSRLVIRNICSDNVLSKISPCPDDHNNLVYQG
jgi:hypothetical protein